MCAVLEWCRILRRGDKDALVPSPPPVKPTPWMLVAEATSRLWLTNTSPWTGVKGRWQHCSASNGRWEKQSPPLLMRARWHWIPLLSVVPRVGAVFPTPTSTTTATTTKRMPKVNCIKCLYISSSVWSVTCSVGLQSGWWCAHLVLVLSGAWQHVYLLFWM